MAVISGYRRRIFRTLDHLFVATASSERRECFTFHVPWWTLPLPAWCYGGAQVPFAQLLSPNNSIGRARLTWWAVSIILLLFIVCAFLFQVQLSPVRLRPDLVQFDIVDEIPPPFSILSSVSSENASVADLILLACILLVGVLILDWSQLPRQAQPPALTDPSVTRRALLKAIPVRIGAFVVAPAAVAAVLDPAASLRTAVLFGSRLFHRKPRFRPPVQLAHLAVVPGWYANVGRGSQPGLAVIAHFVRPDGTAKRLGLGGGKHLAPVTDLNLVDQPGRMVPLRSS
jgi:hypothetical protein